MERDEKDHIDDDLRQVNDIIFGEPGTPKNIEIETATERILAISFAKLIEKLTSKSAIGNITIMFIFSFIQPRINSASRSKSCNEVFLTYRGFQSPKIQLFALIKR